MPHGRGVKRTVAQRNGRLFARQDMRDDPDTVSRLVVSALARSRLSALMGASTVHVTIQKKQSGSASGPVPGNGGLKRIVNGNDAEHPVFGVDDR